MNHIRTYHYYWHIFFFSLLVCMAEFTKAADRDVLERVIYLAKSKGTVYTLLGKVSEQSGFLFVYDSKVVDNDRMVKLGAGQRTIRQAVYEIIGRQDISLRIVENHILINQLQVQCPVVTTSKDTLAYFTLEGKLQDNQSGAPIAYGTVGVVGTSIGSITNQDGEFRLRLPDSLRQGRIGVSHVGYVVTELGTKVKRTDEIKFHDQPVNIERKVYVLLNKPKDCVTTSDDPQERKTVMDFVKGACKERIYPVGRLDRNTTGVLLLTNDGDLASKLTHPKYPEEKSITFIVIRM